MIIKCKMCGGDLEFREGMTVCECEFCGTTQTIPQVDNEKKLNLFNRANRLRMASEFDKAASVYESIVAEFPEEAEAYWGLCLCAYGIEYVDDPATGKKMPTCHRTRQTSIMDDGNFDMACENADAVAKKIYREEAKEIDRLQRDILRIVAGETPYDVFICYKETGADGGRTQDSVLAQDIYDALTAKGLKVFFARITLEDKLGQQYEPYIYAALHSSKVMLAIGTQYEHFDAVWVKNEWSRFLDMMKTDRQKNLIPCYKDIDAYDIPKEFRNLQAQDMGKLGWLQDLTRGVMKLCDKQPMVTQTVVQQEKIFASERSTEPSQSNLLRRGFMSLEDGDFVKADTLFERVLDGDPENAQAYLGKLMVNMAVKRPEDLGNSAKTFAENTHYLKIMRFGDEALQKQVKGYLNNALQRRLLAALSELLSRKPSEETAEEAERIMRDIQPPEDMQETAEQCRGKLAAMKATLEIEKLKKDFENRKKEYDQSERYLLRLEHSVRQAQQDYDEADSTVKNLEAQLANLRGLFNGKRRNELEIQIIQKKSHKEEKKKILNRAKADEMRAKKELVHDKPVDDELQYQIAGAYLRGGMIVRALWVYRSIESYKDVAEILKTDEQLAAYAAADALETPKIAYAFAQAYEEKGEVLSAMVAYRKAGQYKDSREQVLGLMRSGASANISGGLCHTLAVTKSGRVLAAGREAERQCMVREFNKMISVAAGCEHSVCLKNDGTVVVSGSNHDGQCATGGWKEIRGISAGGWHTLGLKADGTVLAAGQNTYGQCNVKGWRDIIAVSGGKWHSVGLKKDGTAVSAGRDADGQCNVYDWKNIAVLSAGGGHTVGLTAEGRAVAVGSNAYGQCDVESWENMATLCAGYNHTVGLKADGTVVAVGNNEAGQCDVQSWKNVVAIAAGSEHTLALLEGGKVLATGSNRFGQCDVSSWNLLK